MFNLFKYVPGDTPVCFVSQIIREHPCTSSLIQLFILLEISVDIISEVVRPWAEPRGWFHGYEDHDRQRLLQTYNFLQLYFRTKSGGSACFIIIRTISNNNT